MSRDAGSIPAASTGHRLIQAVPFFVGECLKVTVHKSLHPRCLKRIEELVTLGAVL